MINEIAADLLVDSACELAEGIQWNAAEQRLYWCDIHGARLWSCDEYGSGVIKLDLPSRIGSFAFDKQGDLLAAFADGFYKMKADGTHRELIEKFEPEKSTTRMNDGRCDRQGRFVVGGMDEQVMSPLSEVVVFDGSAIRPLISNVVVTNSICFSLDGTRMYFADSPSRQIRRYEYDPSTGSVGKYEVFATLHEKDGVPDGSCIDAEDALWNARFEGSSVQRYLPDGSISMKVSLPVSQITCCCFGGENLDKLYITTARESLTKEQIMEQPSSGGIFVTEPAVLGVPEGRFCGQLF